MSAFLLALSLLTLQPDIVLSRLFAATSDGAFVSYSWGEQWIELTPGGRGFSGEIAAFACLGPAVFAGGEDGIFISSDYGESYGKIKGFKGGDVRVFLTATRFALEPTVFVGTGNGLYRSLDGGATWERIGAEAIASPVRAMTWPGPELFVATDEGLYRSNDSGESWSAVTSGLPGTPTLSIAISQYYGLDPTIFVGTRDRGLYRSSDGGEHFERVGGDGAARVTVHSVFWWGPLLLVGTDVGLWLSDDGAEHFSVVPMLEGRAIHTILVPVPEVGAQSDVILGTDEGVFKSSDGAISFRRVDEGLGTPSVIQLATFPVRVQDRERIR